MATLGDTSSAQSVTAAGLALLDDAAASDQRTTLGLGTLATQSGTFSGTSSGTNTGDQTLPTRASLVLATTDSPQFAALNVGDAADTTLARASAGVLSVEGNAIYAAGGTDVAVADGGTGSSTAAAARTALGLDTAATIPIPYLPYRTGGGFYYGWWTGAVSTLVLVQNTMYCAPFFVPVATTFTKIGVVSAAVASSQARLGIYSDTGGVPNALVLDAGAVATTAAAFDVITISQALAAGWYWLACAVQGAAGSLYCNNGGFFAYAAVPVTAPNSSFIAPGYSVTGISGALPSPWGATKTETSRVPNMWLAPA